MIRLQRFKSLELDEMIEIGPGKVLTGFLKKIDKTLPTKNVEDQASLDALLNE